MAEPAESGLMDQPPDDEDEYSVGPVPGAIEPPESKSRAPKAPEPLPRMWKAEPDPDEAEAPSSRKSRKKRAEAEVVAKVKKADATATGADGSIKIIEETPKFDTYEARQRVRLLIGAVLTSILVIAIVIVVRKVRTGEPEVVESAPDPRVKAAAEARASLEQEARNLLENAQLAAKNDRIPTALDLFETLAKSYPDTVAGREAMAALDRHRKKLPLLGPSPPEHATGPKAPPPGAIATALAPANPAATPGPTAPIPPEATAVETVSRTPDPSAVVGPVLPTKPMPAGFKAKPGTKFDKSGWPLEIVCDRDGSELVFVPGGSFTMGRDDGDPPERPAHRVLLASYYIDRHEVTVRQYAQFVRETGRVVDPPRSSSSREAPDPSPPSENDPVVDVTARDAKDYCRWAGKSLPTEAQWEMAARGEDGRIFPWGNGPANWAPARFPKQIDPIMSQPSDVSPYWAFDMAGNAWEWTGDLYDSRYFQQFRTAVAKDPVGPAQSRSRPIMVTVKGGSDLWRAYWREGYQVEQHFPYLGFRGALQAEKPQTPAPVAPPSRNNTPINPGGTGGVVPF